ncbi:chemotaxis protein [Brachyspira suanatina]|uniref:Chemotaxis protein n=1 Tax=Brachyspira suanatina TaxID=381802 RepID=A0A0G4K862_9SPIR|nr:methyl-accepting chemotaxis protein [Brachyspira suanatina]CRF33920.1 chemotaxis protein [Brachyspira suanatina]
MNNKVSLNIKISLFILIPVITIILVFGIINTIYTYKMTEQMTLFIISQMAEKEVYEIESIINLELNYLNNLKYSVENLYNYNVRQRNTYEYLMNSMANEMSTNAVSVSLIFFTNAIDNDNMYINAPLYKDIEGRLGIYFVKDGNSINRINMEESDLQYSYFDTIVETKKPYITTLNYYPIQGKYMPMYTYSIPIFSKDGNMFAVSSLKISLDNIIFYEDTNGFTISLFNEKGDIMYCTTDIYSIGENITNLSEVYESSDLENTIYSNNTIWKESFNKKNSSKYFNFYTSLHIFDDLYWGIELAVDSKAHFFNHYEIIIMTWIIVAIIIILIFIIVPFIINKRVLLVMNNLNDNITKIKEGDISWSVSENYLKMNDEMGDMSREINNTVVYLNDLITAVKGSANKISEDSNNISEVVDQINDCCNNNEIEQNHNFKLINNVNENLKSLLEESRELQKIIKYFKLKE